MDTKSKKSKLTVLPLMLAAAFCFSLGAVLADFVAADLTVFPVVLAMAAALVLGAASLTGTVLLLRRTGYVPRLPAEAGLLFLSGPVLAFLAVSLILPRPEALMPVLLFLAPALTAFFCSFCLCGSVRPRETRRRWSP